RRLWPAGRARRDAVAVGDWPAIDPTKREAPVPRSRDGSPRTLLVRGVRPNRMPEHRPSRPVLLIDDNEDVRVSMKTLLELEGYTVVAACEGEEALTFLRDGLDPCVILLDMLMPGKDGLQFRTEQLAD